MKVEIKPFVVVCNDYHQFDTIVQSFKQAGIRLMYKEISFGYSEFGDGYHGVFWCFGESEQAEPLIKKCKQLLKDQ